MPWSSYTTRTVIIATCVGSASAVLVTILVLALLLCRRWLRKRRKKKQSDETVTESAVVGRGPWHGAWSGFGQNTFNIDGSGRSGDASPRGNRAVLLPSGSRADDGNKDISVSPCLSPPCPNVTTTAAMCVISSFSISSPDLPNGAGNSVSDLDQCHSALGEESFHDIGASHSDLSDELYNPLPESEKVTAMSLVNINTPSTSKLSDNHEAIKGNACHQTVHTVTMESCSSRYKSRNSSKLNDPNTWQAPGCVLKNKTPSPGQFVTTIQVSESEPSRTLDDDFAITIYPAYHSSRGEQVGNSDGDTLNRTWRGKVSHTHITAACPTPRHASSMYIYPDTYRPGTHNRSFTSIT